MNTTIIIKDERKGLPSRLEGIESGSNDHLFSIFEKLRRRSEVYRSYRALIVADKSSYYVFLSSMKQFCGLYSSNLKYFPKQEFKMLETSITLISTDEHNYRETVEGIAFGYVLAPQSIYSEGLYGICLDKMCVYEKDLEFIQYPPCFVDKERERYFKRADSMYEILTRRD